MVRNVAPSSGRLCGRPLDGVGDVVQLEIEKNLLAGRREPICEGKAPTAIGELHADLIESRGIADALDDALGLGGVGHVESDDQPVARLPHAHRPVLAGACPSSR